MIYLKTAEEIEKMRAAGDLTARTLGEVARWVKPGITTRKLDAIAREFVLDNGGRPSCLGYQGFPGTLCIEVNEVVVHGFPSDYVLEDGDIVGTDLVVELDGYNGDSCYTFPVGEVDEAVMKLLTTTKESLYKGIAAACAGKRVGDVSNAVQTYCERRGYSVVREMCGHGIGKSMHESPEVPNFGRRGIGPVLRDGMCIAVEPMINMGSKNITIGNDGWTCRTRDRKPSAHFEHTICISGDEPIILTSFEYIKEAMGDRFV
jgi:methionyl aminopeptidase